jgi:hypothetical protein
MSGMLRLLAVLVAGIPAESSEVVGSVVDKAGVALPRVIVIGPEGFFKRAESMADGGYKLPVNERLVKDGFVSFRHKSYKPRLLRISELRRNS